MREAERVELSWNYVTKCCVVIFAVYRAHNAWIAVILLCVGVGVTPLANATYIFTDLGTFGEAYSTPTAINSTGQVVGYSNTTGDTANHATIWNGTTATDLGRGSSLRN